VALDSLALGLDALVRARQLEDLRAGPSLDLEI
jgi:hypothetical protein